MSDLRFMWLGSLALRARQLGVPFCPVVRDGRIGFSVPATMAVRIIPARGARARDAVLAALRGDRR